MGLPDSPLAQSSPIVKPPKAAYAIFSGNIDQAAVAKFSSNIAGATNPTNAYTQLHVLFHSFGGTVNDGIFLYNLFRGLGSALELTLYNGGAVQSIAVISFLGATHRKTTSNASFLIHRSTNSAQNINAKRMTNLTQSLIQDDQRTEAILRSHLTLNAEQWAKLDEGDLFFKGEESVKLGFAEGIADWSPPQGSQIFNI